MVFNGVRTGKRGSHCLIDGRHVKPEYSKVNIHFSFK